MARATELEWAPESLYNTAISAVVMRFVQHRNELRGLTDDVLFDVYYKVRHRVYNRADVKLYCFIHSCETYFD